jgi:putative ABC transport system permease protein
MVQNFLKIALRSMMRNKAYSLINIIGLAVGVACCLMLALYIQDEMSYDKHHQDVDNLFRVTTTIVNRDTRLNAMPRTSPPIVWGIKDEIPEIETVTRFVNPPGVALNLIKYETTQFYESDGLIADSTFFEVFTYSFVEGNATQALQEPNAVVITEKLARKLFGNQSAINKVININQGGPAADFKVTAVIADNQPASHIKANFFVSSACSSGWCEFLRRPDVGEEWAGQNFMNSYVKLKNGYVLEETITKINEAFSRHGADDMKAAGMPKTLGLEPVKDIHLYSASGEASPRIVYLYVIASIAAFILLIACINFMNLSTAKATKRANEVGLRKTLGAHRASLISQFLGEAGVIVVVSILLSLVIVQFMLPVFNQLTGKTIALDQVTIMFVLPTLIAITVVTGLIAGSYPAFYLSSFQPAKVLKGKSMLQSSNSVLRKSLVVFQFVIAIVLVCGMVIITRQLRFMQEADLGFKADHKIVLPLRTESAKKNYITLQSELEKLSYVNGVSAANYLPGNTVFTDFFAFMAGGNMENAKRVRNNWVEPNYLEVMGIKLIAGRNFTGLQRDSTTQFKVIINESAVKEFGLTPEKAVGERLFTEWQSVRYEFEVIGVMEDYHQANLKEEIYPILFRVSKEPDPSYAVVDVNSEGFVPALAEVEKTWKSLNAETPFEYSFLDEDLKKQYDEDKKVSRIITGFTIIAMIISCLGLYGLSTFMAERRFKEIGVRKVMGASVPQIVTMMSGEFMKLVLIAFIISIPMAWYAINSWLEAFAYKTPLDVTVFLLAGAGALLIALITISFESLRAASTNPVNALRNE